MSGLAHAVLSTVGWLAIGYHIVLHSSYVVLLAVTAVGLARRARRRPFGGHDDLFANPLTPGVSILLPVRDRADIVVERAYALLEQRYPNLELIIIDHGSTDDTFARLRATFGLVEMPPAPAGDLAVAGAVTAVHRAHAGVPLTVVHTRATDGVADALNAGLLFAGMPLVCTVDAEWLLAGDALLRLVAPLVDEPERVVAVGGGVGPLDCSDPPLGGVAAPSNPRMVARIQVVEHVRALLLARLGWARSSAAPTSPAALGVYRRDLLTDLGGLRTDVLDHDLDLLLRISRHLHRRGRGERLGFIPDPVCWTPVPDSQSSLRRRRSRRSRGLAEAVLLHRGAVANPRDGRVGLLVLPHLMLFELLGPLVEVAGLAAIALGLAAGLIEVPVAMLFLLVAIAYPIVVSLASLALEELALVRAGRWRDLAWRVVAAVIEQFGFQQTNAWWRLCGVARGMAGPRPPRRSGPATDRRREASVARAAG